jgi:LysM repeat protein
MLLRRIIVPAIIGISMPFLFVSAVSAAVKHTVSPGETLGFIALIYETSVDELASWNGINDPDVIYPGQELEVPGTSRGGSAAGGGSYTVQAGDMLGGIAYEHGVATSALADANGLDDYDYIYIGQELIIPSAYSAPEVPKLLFPDRPYDPLIESVMDDIAAQEGIPAGLVKAIATVESGWRQYAVSHAGAIGVMQVMPGTVYWLETEIFGYDLYEYDSVYDNVKLGARYVRILLDSTSWSYYDTVAAYYQGLSPTQAGVYYSDTADYASMVVSVMNTYWP